MPAIAGHELPTPGNADTPKQKKHREQAIVIGTLLLVILTFVLVVRRGNNADPNNVMSDPNAYQPDAAGGGSFGDPNAALQGEIGALPGQIAALNEGSIAKMRKRNAAQTARLNRQRKRIKQQAERLKHLGKQEHKLQEKVDDMSHPHNHGHAKHPKHQIQVTHHAKAHHPKEHWTSRPVHPPTHSGKKAQPMTLNFGAIYSEKVHA